MSETRKIRNLLVTGGAGFIGSAFIRYLLSEVKAFEGLCVNLDLLTYAGNLDNLKSISEDSRYCFHRGDIRDEALVEQLCVDYQIDAILHLAAESHVDRSIVGPQAFLETNVMGTFHLLEVVRRHPHIHFHHVSTDEVYGCLGETGLFTEESPYRPNSPYSASKASSDHLVRAYGKTYGLSTCISNCSNNYGPYQFPEKLIPVMLQRCLTKQPLPIYGKGENVRDWLYVHDHAQALWLLLAQAKSGETYNIGGNAEWKNIDLVKVLIRIVAEETKSLEEELLKLMTFVKDRPGHDFRYAIDAEKIRRDLGWEPAHTFEEGIRETVRWYLANQEWVARVQSGDYQRWIDLNYTQR